MKYSKIASSDAHIPYLEDFWANCQTKFEVRKNLWSRLTLLQIKDFNLPFDISGVIEEDEEVVDLVYIEKVEAYPLLEIDWLMPEEDDLHMRTSPVLAQTEKWLTRKRHSRLGACNFQRIKLVRVHLWLFLVLTKVLLHPL